MTLSQELQYRGFINQTTFKDIAELDAKKRTFYWGVDPSASSMQIGNLAAAMMVRVFIRHGHTPVLLIGGATGFIGDPDGKSQERDLKTNEEIAKNKNAIASEYKKIFGDENFKLVDNYAWFKDMGYIDFLRNVGKHVPMRQMLGREFVQSRLSEGGAGISYAEFSYSLIQGYDFLHLFENHGVTLQLSGADQWGNSIAGVDLIRRKTGKEVHVWTTPLIMNKATGKKFGKSEEGAIWLNPNLTSVYKFYQFWLNADDEGVEDYLRVYTTLNKQEIEAVMADFNNDKSKRFAQKTLAYEVTAVVHGKEEAESMVRTTQVLFGEKNYSDLKEEDMVKLAKELPNARAKIGNDLVTALVDATLASSNSEARRFLDQGSIYLNGEQLGSGRKLQSGDKLVGKYAIIRRGKNSNAVLQIAE